MMRKIFSCLKLFSSIALGIILLSSAIIHAESDEDAQNPNQTRISLSILGGYGYSESQGGLADLNLEIQFNFSSHVRAGLGVGYLSDSIGMHMDGGFGGMHGSITGSMSSESNDGFSGHDHSFRVIPITLSLYYVLPVNPSLDIFMLGGGGYYFGSYRDQSTQNQSAFGPHVGLGIDFKIADRIAVVAEGLYRFANLKGFTSELHEGFREGMEGEGHEDGFWHFHHHVEEWHFHEEHENEQQMLMDVPPFDISLNGVSLRIGIKFWF
jgi:opacity protein-like surface antigen